jgi:hypothetical protein
LVGGLSVARGFRRTTIAFLAAGHRRGLRERNIAHRLASGRRSRLLEGFTVVADFNNLARPIAPGTLYILSREYLGAPQDLSPTTPGFVARSQSSVDGEHQFAADMTLTAGIQYWAYLPDRLQPVGGFQASTYDGGDAYVANSATQSFRKVPASAIGGGIVPDQFTDWNFRVKGSRF